MLFDLQLNVIKTNLQKNMKLNLKQVRGIILKRMDI